MELDDFAEALDALRPRCRSISWCMYAADLPTNPSTMSDSVSDHPRPVRISASTRIASRSLSTNTPSQSKMTRSKRPTSMSYGRSGVEVSSPTLYAWHGKALQHNGGRAPII
jgi:hypothetical protein